MMSQKDDAIRDVACPLQLTLTEDMNPEQYHLANDFLAKSTAKNPASRWHAKDLQNHEVFALIDQDAAIATLRKVKNAHAWDANTPDESTVL